MAVIVSWALKRSVFARMAKLSSGALAPWPGTELFAAGHPEFGAPVQVEYFLPAEPDRLCVYGTSVRASRRPLTEELKAAVETCTLEVRVRCYAPGEDVETVDRVTSDLCQAVVSALTEGEPFFRQGSMTLQTINQDPTMLAPHPEPSVITNVALTFIAEVVTV